MARGLRGASRYENELANMLWDAGFAVVRAAASGRSTRRRQPDLMAALDGVVLVLEVKAAVSGGPVYLEKSRAAALREIAERAGGLALVAVRRRGRWLFYRLPECGDGGTRYCRVDSSDPLASGVEGLLAVLEDGPGGQG